MSTSDPNRPLSLSERHSRLVALADTFDTQKAFSEAIGLGESRVSKALAGDSVTERKLLPIEYAVSERKLWRRLKEEGNSDSEPAAPVSAPDLPPVESNATLVDLGESSIWIPYFPARLGAAQSGQDPYDIEPEGGFPLPAAFARRLGLHGNLFAADVAGDSMRDQFNDGDVVFGKRQKEWDREAIYALYIDGGLLVKRIVKEGKRYQLVSNNPAYPPRPVNSEDAYIIGRVFGSINRA